jgi:hypothetical protein
MTPDVLLAPAVLVPVVSPPPLQAVNNAMLASSAVFLNKVVFFMMQSLSDWIEIITLSVVQLKERMTLANLSLFAHIWDYIPKFKLYQEKNV